jgi:hypothetical protein
MRKQRSSFSILFFAFVLHGFQPPRWHGVRESRNVFHSSLTNLGLFFLMSDVKPASASRSSGKPCKRVYRRMSQNCFVKKNWCKGMGSIRERGTGIAGVESTSGSALTVESRIFGGSFLAHVSLQNIWFGFREVYQDQSVHDVTKCGIYVESQ